jgi:putative peptide zinc metalloprotease protein
MTTGEESRTPGQMALNTLTAQTHLTLYPLMIRAEDDEYIVGRIETGEFVALPEVGVQVIELFQRGRSAGEVQRQLQAEYGAEVDIDEFVASLVDLGFVKELDGHRLGPTKVQKPNLSWLKVYHVHWLFSWPLKITYIIVLVSAGLTIISDLERIPHYQDFFWSSATSVVLLVNTAMYTAVLVLHELSHLIAARSLGVGARIGLGTRLYSLVARTDVTGLWAVPRQQRYRVYLAGMTLDLLVASVALLLVSYAPLSVLVQDILKALILGIFFSVLWQLQVFMRTDGYFVLMDLLHCHNLFEDSLAYLRYRIKRLRTWMIPQIRVTDLDYPLDHLPLSEQKKVRVYAWFVLVGTAVSLSVFAIYTVPILAGLFAQAGGSLWKGIIWDQPLLLLDGLVTLLVLGAMQVAFLIVFWKSHVSRSSS